MMADNQTFTTEIPELRPKTTQSPSIVRPQEQSFYLTLKRSKEKARDAQLKFQSELISHHQTKRSLDQTTHQSLIKRIQFLKLYSNKKAMLHQKQLLETRRHQQQRFTRKSVDLVKRRKLQQQLQLILRQNEEEDHIYQLQISNRKNKEAFIREKGMALQRQKITQHHDEIKRRNNEFSIRKKNMHTSLTQRSKNNYRQKIEQELAIIQQYQEIIGEVESFVSGTLKADNSTLCQTLEPGRTFFLTSKNTIQ